MKAKIKTIIILFLYISSFININATIISEGYHFFDVFYYRDIYKNYIKQKKSNKCSIEEGPNCIFIESKNKNEIAKELKSIYPDENEFFNESEENIFSNLKESSKSISKDEKDNQKELLDELLSLTSQNTISLYLTFESYDEITKKGDIYAPETIDNQYEVGRLTLTFVGKLRLSQKNAKQFENTTPKNLKDEEPKGSYAYVESKEVIVKFNSKSTLSSVYIKKNKYNFDNKKFYLYGYKNGKKLVITKIHNVPDDHWIKINGDGKKYDGIGLLRGFDYDNFIIKCYIDKDKRIDITKKYSNLINEKINTALQEVFSQINNGDFKSKTPTKIIKIDLNDYNINREQEQDESFEIPEELLNEINKDENINNEIEKKIDDKKEEKNINKDNL